MQSNPLQILPRFLWKLIIAKLNITGLLNLTSVHRTFDNIVDKNIWITAMKLKRQSFIMQSNDKSQIDNPSIYKMLAVHGEYKYHCSKKYVLLYLRLRTKFATTCETVQIVGGQMDSLTKTFKIIANKIIVENLSIDNTHMSYCLKLCAYELIMTNCHFANLNVNIYCSNVTITYCRFDETNITFSPRIVLQVAINSNVFTKCKDALLLRESDGEVTLENNIFQSCSTAIDRRDFVGTMTFTNNIFDDISDAIFFGSRYMEYNLNYRFIFVSGNIVSNTKLLFSNSENDVCFECDSELNTINLSLAKDYNDMINQNKCDNERRIQFFWICLDCKYQHICITCIKTCHTDHNICNNLVIASQERDVQAEGSKFQMNLQVSEKIVGPVVMDLFRKLQLDPCSTFYCKTCCYCKLCHKNSDI